MSTPAPRTAARFWLALAGLLATVTALVVLAAFFTWPRQSDPATFRLDRVEVEAETDDGSPHCAQHEGWICVVEPEPDRFIALRAVSYEGCTVPWRAEFDHSRFGGEKGRTGAFKDPCHGTTWDVDGMWLADGARSGSIPQQHMYRFPVAVSGDELVINLSAPCYPPDRRCE